MPLGQLIIILFLTISSSVFAVDNSLSKTTTINVEKIDTGHQLTTELIAVTVPNSIFSVSCQADQTTFNLQNITAWQDLDNATVFSKNLGFKLSITNIDVPMTSYLEIAAPLIDDIRIYQVDENNSVFQHYCGGDLLSFRDRLIKHHNFIFPINIQAKQDIYIFISGQQYGNRVPITLWPENSYLEQSNEHSFLVVMLLGIFILLMIYYLVSGLVKLNGLYISYSGLLLAAALLMSHESGLAYRYLWPDSLLIQNYAQNIIYALSGILLALFIYFGLHHQLGKPTLKKLLITFTVIWLLLIGIANHFIFLLMASVVLGLVVAVLSAWQMHIRQNSVLFLVMALGGGLLSISSLMMVVIWLGYGDAIVLLHIGLSWSFSLFILLLMGLPLSITQTARNELQQLKNTLLIWRQDIQTLIEKIPGLVLVFDANTGMVDANPLLLTTLGYTKDHLRDLPVDDVLVGFNSEGQQLVKSDYPAFLEKALKQPLEAYFLIEKSQKKPISFTTIVLHDDDGHACGYVLIAEDLSQIKQLHTAKINLQQQLIKTQRNEVLGSLAGSIAHEMNNILTPVVGYTDMLLALSNDDTQAKSLKEILKSAQGAQQLVQQFLVFTGSREVREPVRLNLVIDEALPLIKASFGKDTQIKVDIDANINPVLANSAQIRQVLMNICANAVQSTLDDLCVIDISLHKVVIDDSLACRSMNLSEGEILNCITIRDNGPGIDKNTKEQVFEPFFTTKMGEQHSGLGLTISRTIMQQHLGEIIIDSELNNGTIVQLFFPEFMTEANSSDVDAHSYQAQGECILLIDDEPAVNEVINQMLQVLGYQVTAFTDAEQALSHLLKYHNDYDVILLDQTMPVISGDELAVRFQRICNVPMIMMSGSIAKPLGDHYYHSKGITLCLKKPVRLHDLNQSLGQVLSQAKNTDNNS